MITKFYLVVNSNGTAKVVKNQPGLNWNEVAIFVNLELPNQLFQKPQLSAQIKIADSQVAPTEIAVDMQNNIKEAIEQATGFEVRLSIENPDGN